MTILQDILVALGWQSRVTENFRSVSPSGLYGINPDTTTGLTLGYLGGSFNGVDVANGTVALTASGTNYVVAHKTTGAVTASTGTTNWLNTSTYLQLYQLVAGASTFTIASTSDKRQAFGWATGGAGVVAGSDKQIQYNNAGVFGAEAGFEYDQATNTMTVANITATGLTLAAASTTGAAGLRLPHGVAPSAPVDGDTWTTSAGLYSRINGATVGPFATSAGTLTNPMTTAGDIIVGGAAGVPTRLAIGSTDGMIPTVIGSSIVWLAPQMLQNAQSAAYTLVEADAGKHILHPAADTTARTFTIPANASVAFPIGTAVTFVNQNAAGVITIAITADTMRLAGAGTTGSRTLAANGMATALKITSTEWIISGTGLT